MKVILNDENASCSISSLSLTDEKRHNDDFVVVNHKYPNCNSSQLFKNIQKEKERSIIFYLQHKGHKRGYIQQQNINLTSNDEEIKKIEIEIVKPKGNSSSTEES